MAKKTFVVEAAKRAVTPDTHHVPVGDDMECVLDDGKGFVIFEPGGPGPVLFANGPSFDSNLPALARAQTPGEYPFSVCYWFEQGGKKEHEALQMVLIIDP
jgi:hypothetical protein